MLCSTSNEFHFRFIHKATKKTEGEGSKSVAILNLSGPVFKFILCASFIKTMRVQISLKKYRSTAYADSTVHYIKDQVTKFSGFSFFDDC